VKRGKFALCIAPFCEGRWNIKGWKIQHSHSFGEENAEVWNLLRKAACGVTKQVHTYKHHQEENISKGKEILNDICPSKKWPQRKFFSKRLFLSKEKTPAH